jgi:hypothetical protein
MPPRYAYWTILIDGKATAFRAKESEELLPTLNQLRRKNADVTLRYFARGKLWDSPEQAQWAGKNARAPQEKRNRDWRPGGTHQDPRARFDKKSKERQHLQLPDAGRDDRNRERPGSSDRSARPPRDEGRSSAGHRPLPSTESRNRDSQKAWTPKVEGQNRRQPDFHSKHDRPRFDNRAGPGGGERQNRDQRAGATSFSDRNPRERKTPGSDYRGAHEKRPWSAKPQGPRERDRDERGRSARPLPDRSWTPKPQAEPRGKAGWKPKPNAGRQDGWRPGPDRQAATGRAGSDRDAGRPPRDNRPRGQSKPFGARDRKADSTPPSQDRRRPWSPKPATERNRPNAATGPDQEARNKRASQQGAKREWETRGRGSRPPSGGDRRRDEWRTHPDATEEPDERREAAPKPPREPRPDRPPSAEKIVTKPEPPERG